MFFFFWFYRMNEGLELNLSGKTFASPWETPGSISSTHGEKSLSSITDFPRFCQSVPMIVPRRPFWKIKFLCFCCWHSLIYSSSADFLLCKRNNFHLSLNSFSHILGVVEDSNIFFITLLSNQNGMWHVYFKLKWITIILGNFIISLEIIRNIK